MFRDTASFGALAGALVVCATGLPALATITTTANAYADRMPALNSSSTVTPFSEDHDVENTVGGHGYAEIDSDFGAGVFTARTHGCVGPRIPVLTDNAGGTASVLAAFEALTIRTDGLPSNASISITLCYSFTSELEGSGEDLAQIFNDFAKNQVNLQTDSTTVLQGTHELRDAWQTVAGDHAFAGSTQRTETRSGSIQFVKRAGQSILINLSLFSGGQTAAGSGTPSNPKYPVSDGSAGFAFTLGLESITEGASLEWRGAPWIGSCADSSTLVPDNPVPAPGVGALAGVGLAMLAGRRRRA